jgi:hypothetical protein
MDVEAEAGAELDRHATSVPPTTVINCVRSVICR